MTIVGFVAFIIMTVGFGVLGYKTTKWGYHEGWPFYILSMASAGGATALLVWMAT